VNYENNVTGQIETIGEPCTMLSKRHLRSLAGVIAAMAVVNLVYGMDRFGNGSMVYIIFAIFAVYLPLPVVSWLRSLPHKTS